MSIMRFYWIGPTGHISRPAMEIECSDDADALRKAAEKLEGGERDWSIEVWDRARRVCKVEHPSGTPNFSNSNLWSPLPYAA